MSDSFESELRAALGDAYVLERELTGSGMSRVFVATEQSLNRQVVVKVLPPELSAGVNRERFRREIQLAAQLQHPHIVPLHAAGAADDLLYFTMPYIQGESLRHALQEGVKFSPREVVRILHDVADALAYAHSRGVIHRDIKPGNVLRSGSHAVVTDFGVAKAISAALPAVGMTTSGMAIGTPAYMAPEQLAGDPAADHRVDIYAVGLLGYELLAGEAPFKASSPQETMAAQLTRAPEPISKRRPDAPAALASLLTRCLAKNPADRPQTATEVVALLDNLEVSSGAMAPQRAFTPSRMWIAGGLIAAAAIAAVMFWPRQENPVATRLSAAPDSTVVVDPPAPTPLTREDSLAIARAIQKKIGEQERSVTAKAESARTTIPAPAVVAKGEDVNAMMARFADSLRAEIQKAVLDSVTRARGEPSIGYRFVTGDAKLDSMVRRMTSEAQRIQTYRPIEAERAYRDAPIPSPPQPTRINALSREAFAERAASLGTPRRVFVSYPTLNTRTRVLAPQIDSLVDTLRAVLARDGRYLLVPADSVRAALAQTRTVNALSNMLNVELFVSLGVSPLADSTLLLQITTRDLGAHTSYATRAVAHHTQVSRLMVGIDTLLNQTKMFLREQDYAPRRHVGGRER